MNYQYFTTLTFGSKGEHVTEVQKMIDILGLFQKPSAGYTQFYGERTQKGIRQFQEKIGLPATGECDIVTLVKLECESKHNAPVQMKTSQAGIDLIKKFEGVELEPYQDVAGYWTIGYGNRFINGVEVTENSPKLTLEQAEQLLRDNLSSYEQTVRSSLSRAVKQQEFDALVSFCYNLGSLRELTEKVNNQTITPEDFGQYVYAGGKKYTGLVRRRKAESDLYFS